MHALQRADLSQHDWHDGQILCNINTSSRDPHVHCVLIDFASVTTGLKEQDAHRGDDFSDALQVLVRPSVGIDPDLVWDNFGKREPWDRIAASVKMPVEGDIFRWTESQDPFPSFVDP